jgi:excisionase family DNA binding protein
MKKRGGVGKGVSRPRAKRATTVPESDVMTFQDVADYLECSYATVLLLVMRGGLLKFQPGGADDGWRVRRSDLEKWIRDRPMM